MVFSTHWVKGSPRAGAIGSAGQQQPAEQIDRILVSVLAEHKTFYESVTITPRVQYSGKMGQGTRSST